MIMKANYDPNDPPVTSLFPPGEARRKTLGVILPPTIAAAIRRRGNLRKSISDEIIGLIDPAKLAALLRADAEHQAKCHSQN